MLEGYSSPKWKEIISNLRWAQALWILPYRALSCLFRLCGGVNADTCIFFSKYEYFNVYWEEKIFDWKAWLVVERECCLFSHYNVWIKCKFYEWDLLIPKTWRAGVRLLCWKDRQLNTYCNFQKCWAPGVTLFCSVIGSTSQVATGNRILNR